MDETMDELRRRLYTAKELRTQPRIQFVSHLRGPALEMQAAFAMLIVPDHGANGPDRKSVRQLKQNVDDLCWFQYKRGCHGHSVAADIHRRALKVGS